jgi:hypothetical protein
VKPDQVDSEELFFGWCTHCLFNVQLKKVGNTNRSVTDTKKGQEPIGRIIIDTVENLVGVVSLFTSPGKVREWKAAIIKFNIHPLPIASNLPSSAI